MRIVNEKLLKLYRGAGECEFCGKWASRREAAHVFGRGHGGGLRLDVAINVVSLCATFTGGEHCHALHHHGKRPTRRDLLEVVARREGTTVMAIVEEINRLRREPKGGQAVVCRSEEEVQRAADLLAWALAEAGEGSPAVGAALSALQWVLGDGAFGRQMLAPLGRVQAKAGKEPT